MAEWRNKVAITTIDAALVQKMFLAGAKNLESKKEWINDLNVFPVPDGDTGTNMTLTIMSAAKEVSSIVNPTMENLAKAISTGSFFNDTATTEIYTLSLHDALPIRSEERRVGKECMLQQ